MPYFLQVINVPLIFKITVVIYCRSSVSGYFDKLVATRLEFYQSVEINNRKQRLLSFLWNHQATSVND